MRHAQQVYFIVDFCRKLSFTDQIQIPVNEMKLIAGLLRRSVANLTSFP